MKAFEKCIVVIGILANLMFYIQAYKIFSSESAEDISGPALIVSLIGICSWLAYGI